jgi:hypothetical protein
VGRVNSFNQFLDLFPEKPRQRIKGGFNVLCPIHDDHKPSLSVALKGTKISVKCQAGCKKEDVLQALGLEISDLFLDNRKPKPERRQIEAIYKYTDANGKPYEEVRTKPKGFYQRRPDGKGGYINDLKGIIPTLYHQDELREAIESGKWIFVVEGEKDVDALRKLGFIATTNPMGAGKWHERYSRALTGADVIIIPDNDGPGKSHACQVAESCLKTAKRVRLLQLPEGRDISDWLERGHKAEELTEIANECPDYQSREKPVITVGNRQLRDVATDSLNALQEANKSSPQIFQRGSTLVRVIVDRGTPCLDTLDEASLRGMLTRAADFMKITESGQVETSPPLDVVRDILALKKWGFPYVLAITTTPVIRRDGTVLTVPGYDECTELFYYSHLDLPSIPETPTEQQISDAVEVVKELLWDFPFDSEASRANAIAALFTPVLRPVIDGPVPLAVVDKPQAGTGASLLCDIIALIATGETTGMIGGFRNDEEWRKSITTTLLRGHQIVVIDNVDGHLFSPSLASLLTSRSWRDRILGRNEEISTPNTTCWFANGNNIRLEGDLPRRAYWIRMDAQEAQPWLRPYSKFRHPNLISWARENRGNILVSILTIARAYVLAGAPSPDDVPTIGSFESWCHTLGGIMDFIGVKGFLGNLQTMYAMTDPETPQWLCFLEAWTQILGNKGVTTAEVAKQLRDNEDFRETLPDTLANVEDKGFTKKLGTALARRLGMRFIDGLVITKVGTKQRAILWKIQEATEINSPVFSFKSESGESAHASYQRARSRAECSEEQEKVENEIMSGKLVEQDSQDSLSATKPSESSRPDRSQHIRLPDGRILNWQWCLSTWIKLGKPCMTEIKELDISLYMYPGRLSAQKLGLIVDWLEKHSGEKTVDDTQPMELGHLNQLL